MSYLALPFQLFYTNTHLSKYITLHKKKMQIYSYRISKRKIENKEEKRQKLLECLHIIEELFLISVLLYRYYSSPDQRDSLDDALVVYIHPIRCSPYAVLLFVFYKTGRHFVRVRSNVHRIRSVKLPVSYSLY